LLSSFTVSRIYNSTFKILIPFVAFTLPYVAFLLILPGIREKRLVSFFAVTLQLGVGVMLICK